MSGARASRLGWYFRLEGSGHVSPSTTPFPAANQTLTAFTVQVMAGNEVLDRDSGGPEYFHDYGWGPTILLGLIPIFWAKFCYNKSSAM